MTFVHHRSRKRCSFLRGAGAAIALGCLAAGQPPACHAQAAARRGRADVIKSNLTPGSPVNIDSPANATVSFALPDPAQGSAQHPRLLAPVIINAARNVDVSNLPPGTPVIVHARGHVNVTYAPGPLLNKPAKIAVSDSLNVKIVNLPPGTPTSVVSRLDVTISFAPGMPSAKPRNLYIKNGLNARVDTLPPGTPVIVHSSGYVSVVWALPALLPRNTYPPVSPASIFILSKANVNIGNMPPGTGPVYIKSGGDVTANYVPAQPSEYQLVPSDGKHGRS